MFGRLGMWELILILVIALVIFGPAKLPEMGRALGRGIREFRSATRQLSEDLEQAQSDSHGSTTAAAGAAGKEG